MKGIVSRDRDQLVVGQNFGVEELEDAVLGGFDGGDVAGETGERRAQVLARLAEGSP
jgi:hypothetical protein